jgi:hypothetical protein
MAIKEFSSRKSERWSIEGWVSLDFHDFGLGVSTNWHWKHHKSIMFQLTFLWLEIYVSAWQPRNWYKTNRERVQKVVGK